MQVGHVSTSKIQLLFKMSSILGLPLGVFPGACELLLEVDSLCTKGSRLVSTGLGACLCHCKVLFTQLSVLVGSLELCTEVGHLIFGVVVDVLQVLFGVLFGTGLGTGELKWLSPLLCHLLPANI